MKKEGEGNWFSLPFQTKFLAYSSNLRKVAVPLWLRQGLEKCSDSWRPEVHPIKRIPSFNPESVKILPLRTLFFFPFVLQIIGGRWWSVVGHLSLVHPREGMFTPPSTRSVKPGPVYSVVKDAVIKEWRKQLELVFCVDLPIRGV